MRPLLKIGIFAGIAGAVVYAITKYKSLSSAWGDLIITPQLDGGVSNIKLSTGGLLIPVKVEFANRSNQQIALSVNAVDIFYKGSRLAYSIPNSQVVYVQPNKITTYSGISLNIPLTSLVSLFIDIFKMAFSIENLTQIGQYVSQFISQTEVYIKATVGNAIVYSGKSAFGSPVQATTQKLAGNLGLVSASLRTISPLSEYQHLIPPKSELDYTDPIIIDNVTVDETVHEMKKIARKYKNDTSALAKTLQGKDLRDTLQRIFDFIYTHIQYKEDSKDNEQIRRPLRTLYDQQGDCDCYSVLIGSILENLGIEYKFRIAAYNGRENYQHVYVVVPSTTGNLIVDPVVDSCFYEKTPSKFKDF